MWGEAGSLSLGTKVVEKPYLAVYIATKCHRLVCVRKSLRLSSLQLLAVSPSFHLTQGQQRARIVCCLGAFNSMCPLVT